MWEWLTRYPSARIEDVGTPYVEDGGPENVATYDYIIVGGGTAGCVLANRLSANPSVTVLLIERGNVNDTFIASNTLLSYPPFGLLPAKGIKTVPQKALFDREEIIYESLSLGGRTRINAGLYLPGCPAEYESWGEGWRWDDVAPFFLRSEGRLELETEPQPRRPYHEGGEWKTRIVGAKYESSLQFDAALARLGVPSIEAYTDPETPTCFGVYQRRVLNAYGRRCSTYHAFLPKHVVRQRKNLTIVLGAHVQRILFSVDRNRLRATEILVEGSNRPELYSVRAGYEILLCGGAIVSPQLLLLSGVGPKDHLTEIGNACIHDLPGVGSTLQDHIYVPITYYIPLRHSVHRLTQSPLLAIIALIQFFLFGTGLFLSIISEYFCYLHSDRLPPLHDKTSRVLPDLEIFWTAVYGAYTHPKFPPGKGAGSILIQNSLPKSSGTVRLHPDGAHDIKVDPIVDPQYLSSPEDLEVYRRGIRFAREAGREMARGGYLIEEALVPASSGDKDLDMYTRASALSAQHFLSSCRMKPLEEGGVVDQELKVHGIEGLRIADGSIFPAMVASRPQATVVMIAERCAEFIRQGWREAGLFHAKSD